MVLVLKKRDKEEGEEEEVLITSYQQLAQEALGRLRRQLLYRQ
jgi:hypothetical protein